MDFKQCCTGVVFEKESAVLNICPKSGQFEQRRLKVKITLECKIIKCAYIELVRAISCTFMHCNAPNFEGVEGANCFGPVHLSIHLPHPPSPPPNPLPQKITSAPLSPPPLPPKKNIFFYFKFGFIVKNIHLLQPPPPPPPQFFFF